jgi:hypothetical protein
MWVEGANIAETVKLVECVETKEDPLIQIVRTHQRNTNATLFETVNKVKQNK